MAMIMPQELPGDEVEKIAAFMRADGALDVPELSDRGAAVLNIITTDKAIPLRYVVVGRFVLHSEEDGNGNKVPVEGSDAVVHPNALCDDNGPTGKWGVVVQDYEAPEDAYLIGVPL